MSATYVYCLVQAASAPRLTGARRGLPHTGRSRLLAIEPGLWLVATDAPEQHYGAKALEQGLKNLEWVARCALGHERVVESLLPHATTIPFRLFTLFHDDARALARMRRRRAELQRLLTRLAGSHEWGLRVLVDGESAHGTPRARSSRAASVASATHSGRDFLEQKRRSTAARRQAHMEAHRCAVGVYASLERIAAEALRRDDPDAIRLPVLLEATFLVPTARAARFKAAAESGARQLGQRGCRLVATGPWAPYSFVDNIRSVSCGKNTETAR